MGDSAQVSFDTSIFENNLTALRRVDSAFARRLEQTSLPSGAAVARARDGNTSVSWLVDGAQRWLGGTSVPSARARGLIDSFQAGTGNCLFVGIGAGREAAELLARMPATSALFVLEPDLANAAMALRVVDLSAEIAARRLVLIAGDDGWSRLRVFLVEHEGFLAPQRVLAWPWLTRDEQDEIGRRLTSLAAETGAERERGMAAMRKGSRREDGAGIAVVSLSADVLHVSAAGGIAWGIERHGHAARVFCADAPERMHGAALSRFLTGSGFRQIVLLNARAGALGDWLPADVPVVTWLTPDAAVPADCAEGDDAGRPIVVSTPLQRVAAVEGGIDPRHIILAPPAGRPGACERRCPVLLLADADDDRAEAAGLHLSSHVALWSAARKALVERPAILAEEDADAFFRRAEAESGVRIGDAVVRQGVLDRIRYSLAPAVLLRACAERLTSARIEFESVVGRRTPTPGTAFAAVIQLSADPMLTSELLNAVADGAMPIVWAARGRVSGAISTVLPAELVSAVSSADELVERVTLAMNRRAPADAREHVLRHHTWRERVGLVLRKPT